MEEQEPSKKPVKSYGGRSKAQWIVIYLIVAAVVYFLIYWIWLRDSDGGNSLY